MMTCILGLIFSSSQLLTKAVVVAAAASIGGTFVFLGLWMEKGEGKGWFLNADDLKRQKLKAKWGWRVLMLGILVEIGTGAALTWHGVSENIIAANKMADIDPLNRPIVSATMGTCSVTLNSTIERVFLIESQAAKDKIILHPMNKQSDAISEKQR